MSENSENIKAMQLLAERLGLPVLYDDSTLNHDNLTLRMDDDGLALAEKGMTVRGDFSKMLNRLKLNNLRGEQLIRAAKIKCSEGRPLAIDATAGLGEDSLLLAAAGYTVMLYEYNPIIAALLRDALRRAAKVPELAEITARMQLFEEDSVKAMPKLEVRPDIILLDPMFPERQKSGLVKKKFQLLQHLEQPCMDEIELVQAAMAAKPGKIVIKRPSKGPFLAGIKPGYSIAGKGIRYDCIVI